MIKILSLTLTVVGVIGLIFGVIGIFGTKIFSISPWALAILGLIFFSSGMSLIKHNGDTDEANN